MTFIDQQEFHAMSKCDQWRLARDTQERLERVTAQVATLTEALNLLLTAEEEFQAEMDAANTSTWSPGYGDAAWDKCLAAKETAKNALKAIGPA